jgi:hypothetical protein
MEWSVLIPTLWRSPRIHRLVETMEKVPYVKEVIIMDNKGECDGFRDGKLIILPGKRSNYVNRSWNQLVEFSRTSHYLLCNDDIWFHPFVFEELNDIDWTLNTVAGVGYGGISPSVESQELYSEIIYEEHLPYGWGQIIAGKKNEWVEIPDYLRIWFGDNWIARTHANVLTLNGFYMEADIETTSGLPEFQHIKRADQRRWETMIQQGLI